MWPDQTIRNIKKLAQEFSLKKGRLYLQLEYGQFATLLQSLTFCLLTKLSHS